MPSPSRRWLRRGLVAGAVLLVAVGATVAYVLLNAPGNVSDPNVHFTDSIAKPSDPRPKVSNFQWPWYGFNAVRTRDFPSSQLHPPFHVGWSFEDYALLEFPPVLYRDRLYLVDNDGSAKAINATNGHMIWRHKVGNLAAVSPALDVGHGLIFVPILSTHGRTPGGGRLVAMSMKTGHIVWSRSVPSGTESSPIVWQNKVFFGDQAGNVYALGVQLGKLRWMYHASGAVKGGPSVSSGTLYFGDYAGRAYALNARNGHVLWTANTTGTEFGFGSGNFYSTPAVAFGRVYMGNTDGRVYSFSARTGKLAWATSTGAYVYSSPAVADTPGLGPTVYIGSYDDRLYAFNARTGQIRWSHNSGGRISGSPQIVGGVVYYDNLGAKTTAGLDARTGKQVFWFKDGAFTPVITDGHVLYLVGYSALYELKPAGARSHKQANTKH
jgi:outer membrane protein assembly factor BamB